MPKKAIKNTLKLRAIWRIQVLGLWSKQLKTRLQKNREYYEPFENEYYDEKIELNQQNQNITGKICEIIQKYSHIIKKKVPISKQKERQKKDNRKEQVRKEVGTYNDGSLGAYGGRKYEGLGARDQFDTFRREKSQNYYSNLQQKSK